MSFLKRFTGGNKPDVHSLKGDDDSYLLYNIYVEYNKDTHPLMRTGSFVKWLATQRSMTHRWALKRNPSYIELQEWMAANNGNERLNLSFPDNFIVWLSGHRW